MAASNEHTLPGPTKTIYNVIKYDIQRYFQRGEVSG